MKKAPLQRNSDNDDHKNVLIAKERKKAATPALWPVSVSVASNADVWPRHTCLASRWLHLCDYTTPLSSESVPHTHKPVVLVQRNDYMGRRRVIIPTSHRESTGFSSWSFSTSTPQAEAASGWNGIHESWQLMSEALHCKKCHVFFITNSLHRARQLYIQYMPLFNFDTFAARDCPRTLPSSSKPQHPSIGLISLSRLL